MNTKKLIKRTLENWKIPILKETESYLVFSFKRSNIVAKQVGDQDGNTIVLFIPGIFKVPDSRNMFLALHVCNELNRDLLQVKTYIDTDDDVIISSEFFYNADDDLEFLLKAALLSLVIAKDQFADKFNELKNKVYNFSNKDDQ